MEGLSRLLQPYKETVGLVATVVTIAQFFSGVLMCKNIYNKKSTKGISATPFIGGVAVGTLMLKYAVLLSDAAMLQVNVAAIFLNILYILFYYQYSASRWEEVLKPLAVATALVAVFLGYAEYEDPQHLEYRYGLCVTVLMLTLMGAPLIGLKEIIEKKDASSIPVPITFMGVIVSFLWFVYGIILLNNFMIVQNFIGFVLCVIQMYLVVIYPGDSANRGQQKSKKKKTG